MGQRGVTHPRWRPLFGQQDSRTHRPRLSPSPAAIGWSAPGRTAVSLTPLVPSPLPTKPTNLPPWTASLSTSLLSRKIFLRVHRSRVITVAPHGARCLPGPGHSCVSASHPRPQRPSLCSLRPTQPPGDTQCVAEGMASGVTHAVRSPGCKARASPGRQRDAEHVTHWMGVREAVAPRVAWR